ncbi:hypothetical protein V6N13_010637 [Hibiscus sabdariffa]|uniref:ADP/ATP translocase n=1 Tax=Hibiscus sabdariffa TaxID=183260 RepID=A0ABR2S9U8_9ROSI
MSLWRGNTAKLIPLLSNVVRDDYWKWCAGNLGSGVVAGASSFLFVYSLDYAQTRLPNDAKAAKKGGERQFNCLIDVYKKTLKSDGNAGLYRGFNVSCVTSFCTEAYTSEFLLLVRNGAGLASYPINTVCRRMMTSGEAFKSKSSMDAFTQIVKKGSAKFLFKGAGANILHAIAGASVLAGYDKLQMIFFFFSGGA